MKCLLTGSENKIIQEKKKHTDGDLDRVSE